MDNGDNSGTSPGEAGQVVARSLSQLLSVMTQATGRNYDALEATPVLALSIGQRQVLDALEAILDQDDQRFARSFPDVDNQTLDDLRRLLEKLELQQQNWNALIVEYWGEGRILIFPGCSSSNMRVDDVTFDIVFDSIKRLEAEFDAMEDESEGEREVDAMLVELRRSLIQPLETIIGVEVYFREYGDVD